MAYLQVKKCAFGGLLLGALLLLVSCAQKPAPTSQPQHNTIIIIYGTALVDVNRQAPMFNPLAAANAQLAEAIFDHLSDAGFDAHGLRYENKRVPFSRFVAHALKHIGAKKVIVAKVSQQKTTQGQSYHFEPELYHIKKDNRLFSVVDSIEGKSYLLSSDEQALNQAHINNISQHYLNAIKPSLH